MAQAAISLSSKCPRIYVAIGAACWASYLINGDASGLSEEERALADAWCERELGPNAAIVDCSDCPSVETLAYPIIVMSFVPDFR